MWCRYLSTQLETALGCTCVKTKSHVHWPTYYYVCAPPFQRVWLQACLFLQQSEYCKTKLITAIIKFCTDNVSDLNCFPFSATALTPDNVLNELKELNWETLCDVSHFGSSIYTSSGVLELPNSEGCRIVRMYASEEERKSAGVSWWVDHHPYASYRLLITQLDTYRIYSLANRIHQYAEKVTGMLSSILYCHWQLYNSS